jgi:hypothetical protein
MMNFFAAALALLRRVPFDKNNRVLYRKGSRCFDIVNIQGVEHERIVSNFRMQGIGFEKLKSIGVLDIVDLINWNMHDCL